MTGQPYDGRGRQAPEWASGLKPEEFEAKLVEVVVTTMLENFKGRAMIKDEWSQAQARMFHATHLKYFSFFAWRFPSWLMESASRCPYQDVRREIIEDCVDEEVGDEDANGYCHVDVLYEEAESCGISRDEIAATEPTPIIHAAILALDNLARTLPWEAAFCSTAALEIMQSKPAVELRNKLMSAEQKAAAEQMVSQSLPERLGIESEGLLFNALHAYKDQFHGGGELKLLVKYAVDERTQHEMLWAAKTAVETFAVMNKEIGRLATEAAEAVA